MKKLIIIGNGFDKGHGLKTTFDDFIKYSSHHEEMYAILKNRNNLWNNVEDRFKEIVLEKLEESESEVDVGEIVEEIIDNYGTDDFGEVSYYDYRPDSFKTEIESIAPIVYLLTSFETDFLKYLRTLYNDSKVERQFHSLPVLQKHFDSASRVINFNYTNVIELVYGFRYVEHIHGDINKSIVIGCDTFNRIDESLIYADYPSSRASGRPKDVLIERMKYYEEDFDGNWIEKEPIKRFHNEVLMKNQRNEAELLKLLKMKSKEYLPSRKTIIESLKGDGFDEAYIIGHSLGRADWSIFNAINANKTICYYHDDDDLKTKDAYIRQNGWNFKLVKDVEVFSE